MAEETGESAAVSDSIASQPTLLNGRGSVGSAVDKVNIGTEEFYRDSLTASFDQQATLQIARWVLLIFAGVYLGAFIFVFRITYLDDVKFDGALEALKFLVSSIMPLVTLAVGYYLGQSRLENSE